jgi:chromosome segregation ATPase
MIDIQIPLSTEYNTATASLLAAEIQNLHTFDEVAKWVNKANGEIQTMQSVIISIEAKQQTASKALALENQDHESKSFLARTFDGRKEQKRWLAEQSHLAREKVQINNVIEQFKSAIDFVPKSLSDQKELIKGCKQKKKELQTEKKEVNTQIASIRVDARQIKAKIPSGKLGTAQRQQVRLKEGSLLAPKESQKAAIEGQIIKLDQMIIWLERIE